MASQDDHSNLTDGLLGLKPPQIWEKHKQNIPHPPVSLMSKALPPLPPPPPKKSKAGPRGLVDYDSDDSPGEGTSSNHSIIITPQLLNADRVLKSVPQEVSTEKGVSIEYN